MSVEKFYSPTQEQIDEADKLVDRRNISYEQAWKELGVEPDEPERSEELGLKERPISAQLAERAFLLLGSLDSYLQASKLGAFTDKLDQEFYRNPGADNVIFKQKRYNYGDIARISESGNRHRKEADAKFFEAYGVPEMIEVGFDPKTTHAIAQQEANKFANMYTGPANKKDLGKLRRVLKKQIKQTQQ
jgi:hypothetical protein